MAKNQSTYTLKIDAELGNLQKILTEAKTSLISFMQSGNAPKGLEKAFERIKDLLGQISDKTGKPLDLKGLTSTGKDLNTVQENFKAIIRLLGEFDDLSDDIKLSFLSTEEQKKVTAITNALKAYGAAAAESAKKVKLLDTAQKNFAKDETNLGKAKKKVSGLEKDKTIKTAKLSGAEGKLAAAKGLENVNPKDVAKYEAEVARLRAELTNLDDDLANANEELAKAQTTYDTSAASVRKMEAEIKRASGASLKQLKEEAQKLGISLEGLNGRKAADQIDILTTRLEEFKKEAMNGTKPAFNEIAKGCKTAEESVEKLEDDVKQATETVKEMDEVAAQQDAFEAKIKSFLGLQGAAQLMRAALRDAIQTITELDATMADMAVVTDLDISDYWNQLPQYTERANELGLAIGDVYKADTLFYQQGLKTNEVVAISTETMKMASIAGLDTAEATDRMTAALRGFNMELNETSAQKIADVYSELAAVTAADVDEISTAMTKTASIASSAGMEFETTAAFLSQIIETTRESAETAGTAMKTVIARFQELKKSPDEIGEVDGEIVDANAIETALRSVGVSLRDAGGQFRELDDVFLELSGKWNTLDKNTQRYIATIAAGSRQQSRFIAMMSDYKRTTELVTAANNSAGASQEQFEKKAESLEFKINQLKNAWHEFTMGIMESDLVKFGVDILTKFLEIVNKATDGIDGFGGSLTKIISILGIFKLGSKIFAKFKQPIIKLFADIVKEAGIAGTESAKKYKENVEKEKNKTNLENSESVINNTTAETNQKKLQSDGENNGIVTRIGEAGKSVKDLFGRNGSVKKSRKYLSDLRKIESKESREQKVFDAELSKDLAIRGGASTEEIAAAEKELDNARKSLKEYTDAEEDLKAKSAEAWSNIGNGISAAGQALTGVGIGISMVGGLMSSLGLEEAGSVISDIGQAITMVGGALSIIPPILTLISSHPIVAIIVGILAAVLALTVGIISAIQNSSPEAKLQRAAENAEAAAEAADQAAESFNNLTNSFDELGDKYKVLEDLRKGTEEWNKAVQDINSSVLELISKYPELAGLVENEGGVLTLDVNSDEAQKVLRDAKVAQVSAQGASLGAKISVEQAKREVELNQIDPGIFDSFETKSGTWAGIGAGAGATLAGAAAGAGIAAATTAGLNAIPVIGQALWGFSTLLGTGIGAIVGAIGGIPAGIAAKEEAELRNETNRNNLKEIAKAYASGETGTTKGEIVSWIEEQGIAVGDAAQEMAAEVLNSSEEIAKYGESLNAMDAANKAYYQAMATNAQQLIDLGKYTDGQINQMTEVVDEDLMAQYKKQYEDELTQGADDSDSDEYKQAKDDFAKEVYGENSRVDGNKILDEKGEVIREFTNDEAFINEMAAAKATKQAAEAMQKIPDIINKNMKQITNNAQEAFKNAFEGKDLTQEQLNLFKVSLGNALTDENGDTDYENIAVMWNNLSDSEKQTVYGGTDDATYERFEATFTEIIKAQEDAFKDANKNIKRMLGESASYSKKLSSAAALAWTNNLKDISTAGGDIDTLNSSLTNMLSGLSEEETELVMQQVNAIDKMDKGAWEGLADTFEQLGISIPTAQLNAFIQSGIKVSGAIEKINFDTLATDINNTYKLLDKIKEGGRTYTEEDYKQLIAGNQNLAKSFTQVGDEFIYVGGSIEDLKDAVKANTDATLQEANRQRQSRADMSKIINVNAANFGSVDAMDKQQLTDYLIFMRKAISEVGGDLGDFGIEGLSMNTSFVGSSLEQLQKWASVLATEGSDAKVQYYEKDAVEGLRQANIQRYVRNDASYNAQMATEGGEYADEHQEALILQAIQSGGVSNAMIEAYRRAIESGNKEEIEKTGKQIAEATEKIVEASEGRDAYQDLIERVTDAIVDTHQEEIDKLGELNDSINTANDKLINKLQEQINEDRQARDNAKTKQDLTDLYNQQAYLAMDTSGNNMLQTADLDKQIAEAEENYQDTLVDQAIQNLQDANAQAAEQRERQISLLQSQLDWEQESGQITAEAERIVMEGIHSIGNGVDLLQTEMGKLLSKNELEGLSKIAGENWFSDVQNVAKQAADWLQNQGVDKVNITGEVPPENETEEEKLARKKKEAEAAKTISRDSALNDAKKIMRSGKIATSSAAKTQAETKGTKLNKAMNTYISNRAEGQSEDEAKKEFFSKLSETNAYYSFGSTGAIGSSAEGFDDEENRWFDLTLYDENSNETDTRVETGKIADNQQELTELWDATKTDLMDDAGFNAVVTGTGADSKLFIRKNGGTWYEVLDQGADLTSNEDTRPSGLINYAQSFRIRENQRMAGYKTGGLADFTGPAWLDGTPSKPEYILNSAQTERFFSLVDVLESFNKNSSTQTKSGDNYFDINISVDKLENDYDVEKIANKIRQMIYEDATYRNVNSINHIR